MWHGGRAKGEGGSEGCEEEYTRGCLEKLLVHCGMLWKTALGKSEVKT